MRQPEPELFSYEAPSSRLWPVIIKPERGEILSSWLTRLAEANGGSLQYLCWETWPGRDILMKDLDRTAPEDVLEVLRDRTGITKSRLRQMTLQGLTGSLFEEFEPGPRGMPWILPVHMRFSRTHGAQFCPDCLKEAVPCFRRNWRLSFITCCSRHQRLLSDSCPSCMRAINPYRCFGGLRRNTGPVPVQFCRWCGWDLRTTIGESEAPVPIRLSSVISLQNHLERALSDGWMHLQGIGEIHSIPWFKGIQQIMRHLVGGGLTKRFRWVVQEEMGIQVDAEYEELFEHTHLFEQLPVLVRYNSLEMLTWILESWPDRFIKVCRMSGLRQARLFSEKDGKAPFWVWSVAREHLSIKYQRWRSILLPAGMIISYRKIGERLSNQASELRERRLQFIQQNVHLHADPYDLVRRMKAEGLYSPNSEVSTLLKHIHSLITKSTTRPNLLDLIKFDGR